MGMGLRFDGMGLVEATREGYARREIVSSTLYYKVKSYFSLRYLPRSPFHRIMNTSANICRLSLNMLTLVAGECAHLTGTSTVVNP